MDSPVLSAFFCCRSAFIHLSLLSKFTCSALFWSSARNLPGSPHPHSRLDPQSRCFWLHFTCKEHPICGTPAYDLADNTRRSTFPWPRCLLQPHPPESRPEIAPGAQKTPSPGRMEYLPSQNVVPRTTAVRLPMMKRNSCDVLSKRARKTPRLPQKKLPQDEAREAEAIVKRT